MSSKTFIGSGGLGGAAIKSIFKKPEQPDLPEQEEVEEIATVTEDAAVAQKRKKKGIKQGGRQSTVLSGIQSALKKRLGE
jgi:hypothetical protein